MKVLITANVIYNLLILLGVLITGCGSAPAVGSLDYIDRQVYQCRELCSAGTVDITRIEGLHCVCNNRKEALNIFMPIVQGGSSPYTPPVSSTNANIPSQQDLQPKQGASEVTLNGRQVFSQSK